MSNVLKKFFIIVCFAFLIILSKQSISVDASEGSPALQEEILYYSDFNQYANGDDASAMWGKDNFFWVELDRAIATVKSREDGRHGIEFALTGVQHALIFGMGSGQAGLLSRVVAGEKYHFSMYVDVTNLGDDHSLYFSYGEGWQIGLHLYGNGDIVVETPATISNQKYENGYLSFDFVAHQTSSYMFCNAAYNVTNEDVVFFDEFKISQFVEVEEPVELVEEILYYSDFNQYANGDDATVMWGKDNFFWCETAVANAIVKTREDGRHGVEFALTGAQQVTMFGMGSGQSGLLAKIVEGEMYVFSMYIDITNLGDDHSLYFSYGEGWQIGIHLFGDGHIVNERQDNAFNPKYENGYLSFEFKAVSTGSYMYCNAAYNVTADDVVFFDDFKISQFVEASQHVHEVVTDAAVPATCVATGLTEGSHCATCGEVLVAQEVTPLAAHTFENVFATAPTCTEAGNVAHRHCSVCGVNVEYANIVKLSDLAHYQWANNGTIYSCTSSGKAYSVANGWRTYIIVDGQGRIVFMIENPANGYGDLRADMSGSYARHSAYATNNPAIINMSDAAVDSWGNYGYDLVIPQGCYMIAVSDSQALITAILGSYTQHAINNTSYNVDDIRLYIDPYDTFHIVNGSALVEIENVVVAAVGHTEEEIEAVAPTCTEAGATVGTKCSVCGEVLVAPEEIPAAHTPQEAVVENVVESTCSVAGSKDLVVYCSVCEEEISRETVALELAPHAQVLDPSVQPTCTTAGYTKGSHCEICNEVLKAREEIPALGHAQVLDPSVEPTCTTVGYTKGSHCEVCGEVLKAREEIAMVEHTYSAEWKHDEANHWHECTVCGAASEKAAHQYAEGACECGVAEPTILDEITSKVDGVTGKVEELMVNAGLGCAGSIVGTFFSLIALASATIVLKKKREEK